MGIFLDNLFIYNMLGDFQVISWLSSKPATPRKLLKSHIFV
jgi:hypothetical protein